MQFSLITASKYHTQTHKLIKKNSFAYQLKKKKKKFAPSTLSISIHLSQPVTTWCLTLPLRREPRKNVNLTVQSQQADISSNNNPSMVQLNSRAVQSNSHSMRMSSFSTSRTSLHVSSRTCIFYFFLIFFFFSILVIWCSTVRLCFFIAINILKLSFALLQSTALTQHIIIFLHFTHQLFLNTHILLPRKRFICSQAKHFIRR